MTVRPVGAGIGGQSVCLCICLPTYLSVYLCMYLFISLAIDIHIYIYVHAHISFLYRDISVYIFICIYTYIQICMYTYTLLSQDVSRRSLGPVLLPATLEEMMAYMGAVGPLGYEYAVHSIWRLA